MMYRIEGRVSYVMDDGWRTSIEIPTFFLDSDVQGIRSAKHALEIAQKVVISDGESSGVLHATAYCVETNDYACTTNEKEQRHVKVD